MQCGTESPCRQLRTASDQPGQQRVAQLLETTHCMIRTNIVGESPHHRGRSKPKAERQHGLAVESCRRPLEKVPVTEIITSL